MELRESGIEGIGDVPWGTHISFVYHTKDEYLENFASYIGKGLLNNELCVWIYGEDTNPDELKEHLKNNVEDIDEYINRNQLLFIDNREWYIENNDFNELRVNKQWLELVKFSIDNGYDGLRAVADTSWLDKSYWRSFSAYEKNINTLISELPFIVVCLYNASKLGLYEFADVLNNHYYNIIVENKECKVIRNVELIVKNKQLSKSQENYRNLLRILPVAVFIHDEDKILYSNDTACRMLGLKTKKSITDSQLIDYIADEMKEDFRDYIKKILNDIEGTICFKSKLCSGDGRVLDIESISSGYIYNGFPKVLSVIRDITPLKKIAKLQEDIEKSNILLNETLEYDKIKTEFFSNLSHELRTPLNVMLSAVQLIKSLKNSNKKDKLLKEKSCLNMIHQNCYRLLRLVNNLIDITKIESGFFELKLSNCNIVRLVEDITFSVAAYIENSGITLQFDTDTEEKVIACDPDQIERVMLNLLSNAVKFTPRGGHIWVNLYDRGDNFIIKIKDSGIGIPHEKQNFIFNRFQQVNKSFNRQFEGSGIGLSLVKSLVEKHGGKITLNSELGRGSEFTIEIPCVALSESKIECLSRKDRSHSRIERAHVEFSDIYAFNFDNTLSST